MKLKSALSGSFILSFVFMAVVSCDSGRKSVIEAHRAGAGETGQGQDNQKPKQDALKSEVLLDIDDPALKIVARNDKAIILEVRFKLNNRDSGYRRHTLNVELGQTKTIENPDYALDSSTSLKIEVDRLAYNTKEYLSVRYQLQKMSEEDVKAESQLVLLFETGTRPIRHIVKSFSFPVPADFSLKDWVDKKLKAN